MKFWILFGIGVILFLTQPRQAYPGDPNASRVAAVSMLTSLRLDVPREIGSNACDRGQYFFYNETTDRYYSKYGVLNTVSAIPPLLAARLTGDQLGTTFATRRIVFWLNLWNIALALALAHYLFELMSFFTRMTVTRIGLLVLTFFCTYVWNYLRAQSSEILQMLFFTAIAYHLFVWRRASVSEEDRPIARRHLLTATVFLSLLILTKTVYVLLAPVVGAFVAPRLCAPQTSGMARVRLVRGQAHDAVMAFVMPLAACALLMMILNSAMFGGAFNNGYTQWENNKELFTGGFATGLKQYLGTINRGVLFNFPAILLGLAGVVLAFRKARAECAFLVGSSMLFLFVNAKFFDPGGSWGYGPRYLVFCLPALAAPGVVVLDHIATRRTAVRSVWMTLIGAVATVFLALQLAVNSLLFMTYFHVLDCMQQFTFYENPQIARYFDDRHTGVASLELLAFKRGGIYGPIESVRAIAGNDVASFVKARLEERVFYNYLLRW